MLGAAINTTRGAYSAVRSTFNACCEKDKRIKRKTATESLTEPIKTLQAVMMPVIGWEAAGGGGAVMIGVAMGNKLKRCRWTDWLAS